jgi:hypothetical protein
MIIIGICMLEEIKMRKQYGKEYDEYRDKTPFLFPIPKWLKKIIKYPMWLIIRKKRPEKRREVAGVISLYTLIFIILSAMMIKWGDQYKFPLSSERRMARVEKLTQDIENTTMRREIGYKIDDLARYGQAAVNPLIRLTENEDPNKKEMAAQALGKLGDTAALKPLYKLLDHPWDNVRSCALGSIVQLGDKNIIPVLFSSLETGYPALSNCQIYESLASFHVTESWEILVRSIETDESEWTRICAVKAMAEIQPEKTAPYLVPLLNVDSHRLRAEAVTIANKLQDKRLLPYLRELQEDEYYEVRLLAKNAIEAIENQ